jgi:catechol 2,3-dioxygenase-like lactoylglutathione lyase family enzyme
MASLADTPPVGFVNTAELARAEAFYKDTLGLPLIGRDPFGLTFALAGGGTMRLTPIPGHVAQPHPVLGWQTADMDATVDDLAASGVTLEIYEGFGQDARGVWTAPDRAAKVAWFKDPDSNLLSLSWKGE